MRPYLVGAAFGAVLTLLSVFIAQHIASSSEIPEKLPILALTYTKPSGPFENADFKGIEDPTPDLKTSEALVAVASRCSIRSYAVESTEWVEGTNESSRIYFRPTKIDDDGFNCVVRATRPPYIRFERTFEHCTDDETPSLTIVFDEEGLMPAGSVCLERLSDAV